MSHGYFKKWKECVEGCRGKIFCAVLEGGIVTITGDRAMIDKYGKFETYVHKEVIDHKPNFHKDPCTDSRARGVSARAHISSRVRAFTPCARASLHGSL